MKWYQARTDFLGSEYRKSSFQHLRGRFLQLDTKILHILIPMSSWWVTVQKRWIKKLTANWKLRGLKLRGLRLNQIITLNFFYENFQHNKTNIFGDFEDRTPTHFQKFCKIFKIKFLGNWICSYFSKWKNHLQKKVMAIFNSGIQPTHITCSYTRLRMFDRHTI